MAKERLIQLKKALESRGIACISIHGYLYRKEIDLNRYVSRYTTKFRKEIRQLLQTNKISLLIDVHSFPISHDEWSYYKVVVLKDGPHSILTASLTRCIHTITVPGMRNDIMDEATEFGVESILLVFREDDASQDVVDKIASCIAQLRV